MKNSCDPYFNVLGYCFAREGETQRIISFVKCVIKDKRRQNKIVRYIQTTRDKLAPEYKLTAKYLEYCKKMFEMCGIYALEDDYVRSYIYVVLNFQDVFLETPAERAYLEKGLLNIFDKKVLRQLAKKMQTVHLSPDKDVKKVLAWYLWMTRKAVRKASVREIAKELQIDPKTAKKYIDEVENMPQYERQEFLKVVPEEVLYKGKFHTTSLDKFLETNTL